MDSDKTMSLANEKGFQVKDIIFNRTRGRKRRIERRLDRFNYPEDMSQPVMGRGDLKFELGERTVATGCGGLGLVHQFVQQVGLPAEIDDRVHLFKTHLPYHESDHVLNLAYNAMCGGTCLEDLELRRQDEAYLNALGADRIPDPTTAGDFCRRFTADSLDALHAAFDAARLKVWAQQPQEFFDEARIEADGTMVETGAECKEGIDISYKGVWGYHPLVVTLANTGEVLRLVNRPGNRPSHEGAAAQLDQCVALCREAGFRRILLRGDTDFSQTEHLDRWHEQGVTFVFGMDVTSLKHMYADDLPKEAWEILERPDRPEPKTKPRSRPPQVKQKIVEERGFKDIRLVNELVAEMPYRPHACRHDYRLIIVRKNLQVSEPRQQRLFPDYRYFLYITNDAGMSPSDVVFSANDRCHQENIIAQLNSLRSLHSPVDNLTSNHAYMLITSLAWNLKAWMALWLPETPGRWQQRHREEKRSLLQMEFRTFLNYWILLPCQVLRTGRRIVLRVLAYNQWQPAFFRLAQHVSRPLRC